MKAKCSQCRYLNYNFFDGTYENKVPPFCGLHGRARVDPDGEQRNLNHEGGCGFSRKMKSIQTALNFD